MSTLSEFERETFALQLTRSSITLSAKSYLRTVLMCRDDLTFLQWSNYDGFIVITP